ncbi:MAG: M48 family metallopeptidase [Candidatus Acidiferrum sp.]
MLLRSDRQISMLTVHIRKPVLSAVCLISFYVIIVGTARAQQSCSVIVAPRIPSGDQIFSIQNERILGDIESKWVESNYRPDRDEELEDHLNTIAAKVLSQVTRDQSPVRVILIDAPNAESFSTGPERIYISRKMVGLLRNDDELAGLVGHELGHILMHQNALIVSQLFHAILGINAVSDREDISRKLTRMLESIDRDTKLARKAAQIIDKQEASLQDEADRVALYASAAAGYSPQAYVHLFDRTAGTNGSSGNVLTDFFGSTTSNLRRLREIQKTLRQLPRPCREIVPVASEEFLAWQADVISGQDLASR